MPQIFLFVFLLFTGALVSESPPQTVQKLSAIAFLLSVSLLIRRHLPRSSPRVLEVHISGLLLILWTFAVLFVPRGVSGFAAPAGLLLTLVFVSAPPLPRGVAIRIAMFAVVGELLLPLAARHLGGASSFNATALLVVTLPACALLFRAFLSLEEPQSSARPDAPMSLSTKATEVMPEEEVELELTNSVFRMISKRLSVQGVLVVSGVAFLLLIVSAVAVLTGHGQTIVLIIMPAFWCGALMLLERLPLRYPTLGFAGVAAALVVLTTVLFSLCSYDPFVVLLSAALTTLAVAALPFPAGAAVIGSVISVLSLLIAMAASPLSVPAVAVGGFAAAGAALLGLLFGSFLRHELLSRSLQVLLQRTAAVARDEKEVARLFAVIGGILSHAGAAVMIDADFQVRVINGMRERTARTDLVFGRALRAKLSVLTSRETSLVTSILGEQFTTAFLDWFGFVPEKLFCCRVEGPPGSRARENWLVIPMGRYVPGRIARRIERTLVDLAVTLHTALTTTRSGQRSSDTLRHFESLLKERDAELSNLVHTINNAVQEAVMWSEERGEQEQLAFAEQRRALSSLAMTASDVRMEREALTMSMPTGSEIANLRGVLEMLADYATVLLRKRKALLKIEQVEGERDDIAVRIASEPHFLLACRMVLRELAHVLREGDELESAIRLRVEPLERSVTLRWEAPLQVEVPDLWQERMQTGQTNESVARWLQQLFAVHGGQFEVALDRTAGTVSVLMNVERVSLASAPSSAVGDHWALFVDDAAQVTNFYSKVAAALALRHETAASISDARAIMKRAGAPHLLVTDVQLTDGSGIELVRAIRQHGNDETRVIVVSGETRDRIDAELRGLDVDTVLTKPISRSTLFDHIRRILVLQ